MATYKTEHVDVKATFVPTVTGEILPDDAGTNNGLKCQNGVVLCRKRHVNLYIIFT